MSTPVLIMTIVSAIVWLGWEISMTPLVGAWLIDQARKGQAASDDAAPDPPPVVRAELAAKLAEDRAAVHVSESRTQLARMLADIDRINVAFPPREQPGGMYKLVTDTSGIHLEPE